MRCIVPVKATAESEAGVTPSGKLLVAMDRGTEELVKTCMMLAG